jgi:hypothetical protein
MIFIIPDSIVESYTKRLTNQLWKLIPMRENEENWLGQLETLIIEIAGFGNLVADDEKLVILLTKLEGLRIKETDFSLYRKIVFESISLLRELRL